MDMAKTLELMLDRHQREIDELADACVQIAVTKFKEKFPKRTLEIVFGMGTEVISIDDEIVYIDWAGPYRTPVWTDEHPEGELISAHWTVRYKNREIGPDILDMLVLMTEQVSEITDGYRRGCPNNVGENDE